MGRYAAAAALAAAIVKRGLACNASCACDHATLAKVHCLWRSLYPLSSLSFLRGLGSAIIKLACRGRLIAFARRHRDQHLHPTSRMCQIQT